MVRYGTEFEDTHEKMQIRRVAAKYQWMRPKRHIGNNRLLHKGDNPKRPPH